MPFSMPNALNTLPGSRSRKPNDRNARFTSIPAPIPGPFFPLDPERIQLVTRGKITIHVIDVKADLSHLSHLVAAVSEAIKPNQKPAEPRER